jgi:hypothetical protein
VGFGEEMYYLRLRGPAEKEDFGRQRTEASRADSISKKGVPTKDDGSTMTVIEVSDTSRHEVAGFPLYLFTFTAAAEAEGETRTYYTTIGFGSVGRNAIWFQHTSANLATHPSQVLSFIEDLTFYERAQDESPKP